MSTVDRIADLFAEAQREAAQLDADIGVKQKERAAIESQCSAAGKALAAKSDELVAVMAAVNAQKAELVRIQSAIIDKTKLLEETEAKLKKIAGWKAA